MRKLLLGVMAAAVVVSLNFGSASPAAAEKLRIAMVLWRGETEADQGFKDKLRELGYATQYTVMDAKQDRGSLRHLLTNVLIANLGDFDYVYSYGTTASQMTKFILQNRIPHVFSNVAAPVRSKVVRSMDSSGENISGTSNRIPVSVQIEIILRILKFKRIGILFNPREKNSALMREELYRASEKFDFQVVDLRSPPAMDMLQKNLRKLTDRSVVVDAIYLPLDSFLITQAEEIGAKLRAAKIPSIGAQKKFMGNGALLGVIPDYYALGQEVAMMVHRHRTGEALGDMRIGTVKEPILMINETTRQALDITIPKGLVKNTVVVY